MEKRLEELMDKKVYKLVGTDVIGVLQDMDKEDLFKDEERLEELLDFVDRRLEIPWEEYIEATIENFLFREELREMETLIAKEPPTFKFEVPITWEAYGTVEIEAKTPEEAFEIVRKNKDEILLPIKNCYVDGSLDLSSDDYNELKDMMK